MPISPVAHSLISPRLLKFPHLHLSSARLFCVLLDQALQRYKVYLSVPVCFVPAGTWSKVNYFPVLSPEPCIWVHPNTPVTEIVMKNERIRRLEELKQSEASQDGKYDQTWFSNNNFIHITLAAHPIRN